MFLTSPTIYDVHNLVTIRTNIAGLLPEYFAQAERKRDRLYDIEIFLLTSDIIDNIVNDLTIEIYTGSLGGPIIGFAKNAIYAELRLPFLGMCSNKLTFRTMIKKIENRYQAFIEFSKFFKFQPIMYRVKTYLQKLTHLLLTLQLLEKNCLFTHSAAVSCNSNGILIFAFSNTGKTPTSQFLAMSGMKYMSDDHTIIGGGPTIYAFPEKSGRLSRLREKTPLLDYLLPRKGLTYNFEVNPKAILKYICILSLSKAQDRVMALPLEQSLEKLIALNNEEILSFLSSPLTYLTVYSSFHGIFPSLERIFSAYKKTLTDILSGSDVMVYEIRSNPEKFGIIIKQILKGQCNFFKE